MSEASGKKFEHWDLVIIAILFPVTYILDSMKLAGTFESVITIFFSLTLIILASERFLDYAKNLALKARIPEVIVGLTIVSIGTSLPEIASTGMASFRAMETGDLGFSDFAIGNIYGSVLVQITAILGVVILVRPMRINRESVRRDGLMMVLAVILLTVFVLWDGQLGRIESICLAVIYALYILFLVRARKKMNLALEESEEELKAKLEAEAPRPAIIYAVLTLLFLAVVVFASGFMVNSALNFAASVGVGGGVIGLTISSVGTSLPELAVALAAIKTARDLGIGALIGSNVTDPLLSIGIAGMINPIVIPSSGMHLFMTITVPVTIIACVASVLFMWTKWELERWEGATLVAIYGVFIGLLVFQPF